MWEWEQGRLAYFQFDELRKLAKFGSRSDLRTASREDLSSAVGLEFLPKQEGYPPWRNYSRLFQIAMIAVPHTPSSSKLTRIGQLLAGDGQVTSDEYLHFLARGTTHPSPAHQNWGNGNPDDALRYPLLFSLKYLLMSATNGKTKVLIREVVNAYRASGLAGNEGVPEFKKLLSVTYSPDIWEATSNDRQASESLRVLSQLSYLTATRDSILISLAPEDASKLFANLKPVSGESLNDRAKEIDRRAAQFPGDQNTVNLDYSSSIVSNVGEAGFLEGLTEGSRVRRSHLMIERNKMIRDMFFQLNPNVKCDFCGMDSLSLYPWTERLLEVHHLLPLCSGARTTGEGTVLSDLVANCPSCHRAVHRFYDRWLKERSQIDFTSAIEAKRAYESAKHKHYESRGGNV